MVQSLKRTPLHSAHLSQKARIVPFAGWEMPVQYGGIIGEAKAVRSSSGIFDVSHMGRLYVSGPDSPQLMDWILTSGALGLRQGRARYGMVCNQDGGIIDDAVFYRLEEGSYLLICNAANHGAVLGWLQQWASDRFPGTQINDRTKATVMIAFQGPSSPEGLDQLCEARPSEMRPFSFLEARVASHPAFIGRTGYTGEVGFELIVSAADGADIWQALLGGGAVPCGLGARDVLRLEAGLPLHGNDIDTSTTPMEAGLERFVRLDHEFVGAEALRRQVETVPERRLVGMEVEGRSIARAGYLIYSGELQVGTVTSGTLSPALEKVIAMGYLTTGYDDPGQVLQVDVRGKLSRAEVVPLPFYSRDLPK